MTKPLTLLTALLVLICLGLGGLIAKELTATQRLPRARTAPSPAGPTGPDPAAALAPPAPAPAGAYQVVVSRNLFSPTRTEAPPPPPPRPGAAPPAPPVVNIPKPSLYGVVMQEGTPVAYLEDPTTKRVARYRIGDSIAGGTLQTINSDSVVLSRPDGQISVRLHDPTRARPASPVPGAVPQPQPQPRPQSFVPPAAPDTAGPSRRPLPPSVLGRTAPQGSNAPTTQ